MTKFQKRAQIFPAYGGTYDCTIFSVCMDLHMSNIGSSDPLDKWVEERNIKFLQCCLATWEDGLKGAKQFDDAVKSLIMAALDESLAAKRSNT